MAKTISLLQPWASLVVMGHKRIETRGWSTIYRGPLLIHASKGRSGAEAALGTAFRRYIPEFNALPFGAIIGEAVLENVLRVEALPLTPAALERFTLEERAFGDYSGGRWAWMLRNAVMWDNPVPATGRLGLWEW